MQSTGGVGGSVRDRPLWTMSVEAEPRDGELRYRADVFENGVFICRIALSGGFANQAAAEIELERRLKRWMTEYESRCEKADWD